MDVESPVRDMGVVSMLALYGVVSGSACSPSSEIIPNYKAAWERQPVLIEQLRSKLDDYGDRCSTRVVLGCSTRV